MKNSIRNIIISIGIISSLASCNSRKTEEVIVANKFKINIPTYMSETNSLNEDASLQYQSIFKGMYLIVMEDNKKDLHKLLEENQIASEFSDGFNGFTDLMFANGGFWDQNAESELKDIEINGLKAKVLQTEKRIEGINIYYRAALIEGKDTYYQVVAWTSSDKKTKNEKDIEKIVNSFSEL